MKNEIKAIEQRMAELDRLIKETRGRIPAHSARPGIMMELMEYEDEYERLMEKMAALKPSAPGGP